MNPRLRELEQELRKFPASVVDEFRRAAEVAQVHLPDTDLLSWAQQGVDMAHQTARAWEAASAYFRSSPQVLGHLSPSQLLEWGRCGSSLCGDSPALAVAFFQDSPAMAPHVQPHLMAKWANLGRAFYRGTWKSCALATKFFEVSSGLLGQMRYEEVEEFAGLARALSQKSFDLATESLLQGQQVLPKLGGHRLPFLKLVTSLVDTSWREVKECFDVVPKVLAKVHTQHRDRLFSLATLLAPHAKGSISLFLSETATALGKADAASQGLLLAMAEQLVPIGPEAAGPFLLNSPAILGRISLQQLPQWFQTGVSLLQERQEGGLAYFRLESATSEQVLESLSSAVELDRVKEIMRLYCRALAGAQTDIAPTTELVSKNIGWVSERRATTEGTTVYLPPQVERYGSKEANFALLKVLATHQAAHIEFGSFGFSLEAPARRFRDLRFQREQQMRTQAGKRSETRPPDGDSPGLGATVPPNGQDGISGAPTPMGRFFDLFDNRRLALDIFTAVEDGRLDYQVQQAYLGLAPAYRRIQQDALVARPPLEGLPAQQAMVEFLVRLSLQQAKDLQHPEPFRREARAVARVARRVFHPQAMVEDSAEATLRIYDIIATLPNTPVEEEESGKEEERDGAPSDEQLDQWLQQFLGSRAGASAAQEGHPYESPPPVEYRGDFKPELAQLLSLLRQQQEQQRQQGPETARQVSPESLQQVLANTAELELDAEAGQLNHDLAAFAQNLMRETGATSASVQGQGQGPFLHMQEPQGGALEAKEPLCFVYNEWDFRAVDYKPRWCVVREKAMAEGEAQFFADTLRSYSTLTQQIRRQFEMLMPEAFRKIKHLPDGEEFDLDAVVEAINDKWCGVSPSEKLYWRRNKVARDVAVVFLMDMSASTAEAIDESRRRSDDWAPPDDPVEYMNWLRSRRGQGINRNHKRIIDLEKESTVLLIQALETIGDTYGIYGFSGYGRENVEFYVIKDIEESFSERIKRRIDKITPLHATRMGPAIRHATFKLARQDARTKLLLLISDGRPQDRGYSREGVEKEYAVHDTKMALTEARHQNITPFCLTVDRAGHDYLKTMCQDMGYEVLGDIHALPTRLPTLYRKLTF
ncbi:MAG: hypothetical protein HY535_02700 [Chloroflexi bacterium]|nr:hypothetical protein [Chloroflexota bacterium]